jgi:tetratricopeptide (TPR) repeat protein
MDGLSPQGATRLDPDALAALEEQHDFLVRSLDDLDRELEAGDLDEHDHAALKEDYERRAAAVERAIEDGRARFAAARRPRSPARAALAIGAVVVVAVLAGVLVAQASGRRDAGDQATGDIRASARDKLGECLSGEGQVEPVDTLKCYDAVLAEAPDDAEALTYRGWFLVRAGLVDEGYEWLERAVAADPTFPDARVFRAIVLLRDRDDPAAAKAELDAFYAADPSAGMRQLADPLRAEVDTALAAGVSGTTTTP